MFQIRYIRVHTIEIKMIAKAKSLDDTRATRHPKLPASEAFYVYGVSQNGVQPKETGPPNGSHPRRNRKEKENYLHTVRSTRQSLSN
jgi:hypothetical protein